MNLEKIITEKSEEISCFSKKIESNKEIIEYIESLQEITVDMVYDSFFRFNKNFEPSEFYSKRELKNEYFSISFHYPDGKDKTHKMCLLHIYSEYYIEEDSLELLKNMILTMPKLFLLNFTIRELEIEIPSIEKILK